MKLLEAREARLDKQHKEAQDRVLQQKNSLEHIVLEITGKKILIQFD
jgi:hypothetical protein